MTRHADAIAYAMIVSGIAIVIGWAVSTWKQLREAEIVPMFV